MSGKKPKTPKERKRERREKLLDDALDASFPASDPPSITSPHPAGDDED